MAALDVFDPPPPGPERAAVLRDLTARIPAVRRYLAQVDPARAATWVMDNRDLDRPHLQPVAI